MIQPMSDRVLLDFAPRRDRTQGGLYIPDVAQTKMNKGIVQAIGDSEEIKVKVGDMVFYDMYAGTPITEDGKKMILVKNSDIMAIIEEE